MVMIGIIGMSVKDFNDWIILIYKYKFELSLALNLILLIVIIVNRISRKGINDKIYAKTVRKTVQFFFWRLEEHFEKDDILESKNLEIEESKNEVHKTKQEHRKLEKEFTRFKLSVSLLLIVLYVVYFFSKIFNSFERKKTD